MTPEQALHIAVEALMAELTPDGHWVGELSSSALAGAVAIIALHLNGDASDSPKIERGLAWLIQTQKSDGGWGDCPKSLSNPSTTLLVLSALKITGRVEDARALAYLKSILGDDIAAGIHEIYGEDHTFSVPILTTCAIAGIVSWSSVPRLPYPLAAMPYQLFNLLKLQVVSYAMPALIAVGLAIDKQRGQTVLGKLTEKKALRILQQIMPESGGFLEATPLTAFVSMSLLTIRNDLPTSDGKDEPSPQPSPIGWGREKSPLPLGGGGLGRGQSTPIDRVLAKALIFLRSQQREDGSWPIDTNLAQWVTSCAINALRTARVEPPRSAIEWTLANQTTTVHPFTHAAPGGWGWTDLSGSVPDGDDTSAAQLVLSGSLTSPTIPTGQIEKGITWLLNLQNRDGGWPPFCRGWGRLPFDQSCADITAHAIRAIQSLEDKNKLIFPLLAGGRSVSEANTDGGSRQESEMLPPPSHGGGSGRGLKELFSKAETAKARGYDYLAKTQRADGSWVPLWFGSQLTRDNENPAFGTARVLMAYGESIQRNETTDKGINYLLKAQNVDGGWGAAIGSPSMLQETSLSLSALSYFKPKREIEEAIESGLAYLIPCIERDGLNDAQPIGLYFAKLWYSEKLYPMIWAVEALGRCLRH